MFNELQIELRSKMTKAIEVLKREFSGLRTGRASINLLDGIKVSAYGSDTPLSQVASLSVPDARTLSVSVWDKGMIDSVMKAIIESELGLNPQNNGTLIRIPLPVLTEERRKDLVKTASSYAENCKTSIRNLRRDGMDTIKTAEKNKEISEDDRKNFETQIQDLTDKNTKEIDDINNKKANEIMEI